MLILKQINKELVAFLAYCLLRTYHKAFCPFLIFSETSSLEFVTCEESKAAGIE